jgi:histidine ammonia-lyase
MGTIAARDGIRVIELTEQVLAAVMLGAAQAWELRSRQPTPPTTPLQPRVQSFQDHIRKLSAFVDEDRPLDDDLRSVLNAIRRQDIQCEWQTTG